jgi:hypothetical protein
LPLRALSAILWPVASTLIAIRLLEDS